MNVEITDSGGCIVFGFDGQYIAVNKQAIRCISLVGDDKVCIDTGKGVLELMYITAAEVAKPDEVNSALTLLKVLKDMIATSAASTLDNASMIAKLQQQLLLLAVPSYQTAAQILSAPLLTDNAQTGVVFEGYAAAGTKPEDTGWAIKLTRNKNGVSEVLWANGMVSFINIWDDRYDLAYQQAAVPKISSANSKPS